MITLTVNGKQREIAEPTTLSAFLQAHNINPRLVAVEYNGEIVRRDGYDAVMIKAGDKLEIVHMVGGGAV
jgi:sulfur carrier protein